MEIIMTISGYLPFANLIEKNMPFYIATIGNPKFQPPVHRPLGIEDYQLLYTEDGGGSCFINGKTFELCPGDIVYLPPNTAHEYFCGGDIWETIYITFNGSGMTGFFDFEPSVWRLPPDFDFKAEYAELDRMKKNPDCFKETSAALYLLLLRLREYTSPVPALSGKSLHLMTLALHCMSESRSVSLSEISDRLGISEEHFCRIFKEYTGFRPFEYMNLMKMQKARELLKNTKLPIGEISDRLGYDSHSYFSMIFKRYIGITPTEYRRGG